MNLDLLDDYVAEEELSKRRKVVIEHIMPYIQ